MPEVLIQTKLYIPPLRPELVPRPHIIEKLNQGLQLGHRLTLISAPAGFGKTTLVREWVGDLSRDDGQESSTTNRVAWLSLDENDNDPIRFLAYLVAALSQVEGIESTIGKGALGMLQSPQPPPAESVLTSLINDVAAVPERLILVLDDYHLITSSPVDDALTFFLEHLPPHMYLVIATRIDPDLPIARLRARDQLTELRAAELRFSTSEVAEFLNRVMGLDLSAEDIASLETRTEGWIAGLQLAAVSMQGQKYVTDFIQYFTGSHRYVLDYLVEEVLEQQPESVQLFLLRTAILNRLSGSLCDALTDQNNGQATLEMLDHANLFIIPLDEERLWYRYHHLFSDLLRQRLRQTRPDWPLVLHQQASVWYKQNGFTDEAIEHALRAEDYERTAHLIEEEADALWQRGEQTKLRRWLDSLPAELVLSKPYLCILQAWDLFTSGHQEAAEQSLNAAEKALLTKADSATGTLPAEQGQLTGADRMKIQGRVASIRAFLAFAQGDVEEIHKYALQALEFLPEMDLTWRSAASVALGDTYGFSGELAKAYQVRMEAFQASKVAGNTYMTLIASMKLAVTMRELGQLEQVLDICQQQLQLANESGLSKSVMVGWLLAIWGEVLAELNDLEGAIHQAEKGAKLAERGRDAAILGWSHLCLTRVLFARGDLTGAEEIIHKMEDFARDFLVPPWITNLLSAWQARIWLAQDRMDAASEWLEKRKLETGGDLPYLHETEYIVLARILMANGQVDEAANLIQRLFEATEAGGRISRMIEILIIQVSVFQARSDPVQSMAALARAITLAQPGGFVRIFVDEGPSMARLLYEALSRGIAPDYIRRLLAAFQSEEFGQSKSLKSQVPESDLIEPLSEREIEVLQLIAEGLTNREIGDRLFLSLNTVKAHTRNIYSKLSVHNRTQAIVRSQELGLLPRKTKT